MIDLQLVKDPVVEGPIVFKLHGADGMGDSFDGIGEAMGEVVHGIDAPLVPCPVMGHAANAVEGGIAQVQVGRGHVDFGPEHPGTVLKLTRSHALKQIQVLLHRTVAIGALTAGLGQGASVLPDLLGVQVADIGLALFDQLDGVFKKLGKVV